MFDAVDIIMYPLGSACPSGPVGIGPCGPGDDNIEGVDEHIAPFGIIAFLNTEYK